MKSEVVVRNTATGQFLRGTVGGPGQTGGHPRYVAQLRAALVEAVTRKDVAAIAKRLVHDAKGGNTRAAHEVLDRLFGKAAQTIAIAESPTAEDLRARLASLLTANPAILNQISPDKALPESQDQVPESQDQVRTDKPSIP